MAHWLFKSEPGDFSWDDLVELGEKGTEWDGVRNYQARNNMREMKVGDRGFFYHSVKETRVVGIVEVIAEAHQDSTTDDPRWECVDLRAVAPVPRPVTLAEMRKEKALEDFALLRQSRLSVVPVSAEEWRVICRMAEYEG